MSAESVIEQNIQKLGIFLKFRFQFDKPAIHEFYSGESQRNQMKRPPERDHDLSNRWEEFVDIMTSGNVTGYILVAQDYDAVAVWRQQVGSWDIENKSDPATLRGRFGVHNYSNLLHGSDSPEEALREIRIIQQCVERNSSAEEL